MTDTASVSFGKECFIVMPLAKSSPTALFDEIYQFIIKPAVEETKMECKRVDEFLKPGSIIQDIVEHLSKSNICIADLSGQNANVFYEVGVRDALRGRMILLAQNINDVPYDLRAYRVCIYNCSTPRGYHEAKKSIVNYLNELQRDPELKGSTVRDFLFREGLQKLTDTPDLAKEGVGLNMVIKEIHSTLAVSQSVNSQTLSKLTEVNQHLEIDKSLNEAIRMTLDKFTPGLISNIEKHLSEMQTIIQTFSMRENVGRIYDQFGIESVHRNRLDAIEHSFYQIMEHEKEKIDIVGSTIFGLKGHSYATFDRIVELLKNKRKDNKFTIRLLLTHHDYLSLRQSQERVEKRPDRWVISKEAVDAIDVLRKADLLDCVKFYRGSPTCFTIVCHGEGRMLLNPYPYEREAFNSWSLIIRNIPNSIYNDFLIAHIEKPWTDDLLLESYSVHYSEKLNEKYQKDVQEFFEATRAPQGTKP